MKIGTIDIDKLQGVGDKFVGLYKETAGVLFNNDRLQKAGEAQQDKASEKLKALRDETEAEAKEAKAESIGRTTPNSGGKGVFAEVKGKAKQAVGNATGDSSMQQEGEADEERGATQRSATKDRVSAKAHEARAEAADKAQQGADSAS